MPEPIRIEDDGFVQVSINGQEVAVDVFEAHNTLCCANSEVTDELPPDASTAHRAVAFQRKVAAYLRNLGFESASLKAADAFADAIFSRVQALGKAEPGESKPG